MLIHLSVYRSNRAKGLFGCSAFIIFMTIILIKQNIPINTAFFILAAVASFLLSLHGFIYGATAWIVLQLRQQKWDDNRS